MCATPTHPIVSHHPISIVSHNPFHLQVRPHDKISFKQVTIEDAYTAALRTDALVSALRAVACGDVTSDAAAAGLEKFTVAVPKMPKTKAVLVDVPATGSHPGYLVRLAGDRCARWQGPGGTSEGARAAALRGSRGVWTTEPCI